MLQIDRFMKQSDEAALPANEKMAIQKAWRMVKKYMLRVESNERMPIAYILKKIKKVQKIYDGSSAK